MAYHWQRLQNILRAQYAFSRHGGIYLVRCGFKIRQSALFYPIVLATHLTCIAIFGGIILVTDLRLLGWALILNTSGTNNTCLGASTCYNTNAGSHNTHVGFSAGSNATNNGSYNIFVGDSAGLSNTSGSSNVYLANTGAVTPSESNTIRIGTNGAVAPTPGTQNKVYIEPILANADTGLSSVVTILPTTGQLGFTTISGTGGVGGTCNSAPNYVVKWTAATTVDCSHVWENPAAPYFVGIGTAIPLAQLDVASGDINVGDAPTKHHYQIGNSTVLSLDGSSNTLVGEFAGKVNTGAWNTFVGNDAGLANKAGSDGTFLGYDAGSANTTGNANTAVGFL